MRKKRIEKGIEALNKGVKNMPLNVKKKPREIVIHNTV